MSNGETGGNMGEKKKVNLKIMLNSITGKLK
jgi:hypothetical protein